MISKQHLALQKSQVLQVYFPVRLISLYQHIAAFVIRNYEFFMTEVSYLMNIQIVSLLLMTAFAALNIVYMLIG